ncbi:MAG: PDGLE domain-containing protein [Bacillota bacterium]
MRREIWIVIVAAVIVAGILSPFASSDPDGLEKVARTNGFIDKGEGKAVVHAPMADYTLPGVRSEGVSTAVAGIAGTALTFVIAFGAGRVLRLRRRQEVEVRR